MELLLLALLVPLVWGSVLLLMIKTIGGSRINRRTRRSSNSGSAYGGDAGTSSGDGHYHGGSDSHSGHDSHSSHSSHDSGSSGGDSGGGGGDGGGGGGG